MERWACAVVRMGIPEERFWSLSPREYAYMREAWSDGEKSQINMLASLRAEIRNAWTPRKDGSPWTVWECGGVDPPPPKRNTLTPEEFQKKVIMMYGPDGKGAKHSGAVAAMRGKGQPLR